MCVGIDMFDKEGTADFLIKISKIQPPKNPESHLFNWICLVKI